MGTSESKKLQKQLVENRDDGLKEKYKLKIQFFHGIQNRPIGAKTKYLQNRFTQVESADMEMSIFSLFKKNSIMRSLFRNGLHMNRAAVDSLDRCLEIQRQKILQF